ncbi:DUF4038 domain-containing protein [Phycisphaerales bacterium AB-hyl4]|uniref:DUF4038 domain-containing protein n=1 Tax=Natronomicrosphaera hydrolytica TaxID=3242702 RepID=A0ABV4U2Y1_9BACT
MMPEHHRLRVASNGRYLERADGSPFFYLGDTAWHLCYALTRDEMDQYLQNRAAKGFTVVQTILVRGFKDVDRPNAQGDMPFVDNDPTRPNEAYFEHVDHLVARAAELGLFVGLLPSWGNKWRYSPYSTPGIFRPDSAESYGQFLAERYRGKPVIWILGGDRNVLNDDEMKIIEGFARGLRDGGAEGEQLITFHPYGPGRSSDRLHAAEWLDFNMCQTSHAAHDYDNGLFIDHDYALSPAKPTLDAEPRYENLPVGFYNKHCAGYDRFDDYDVRQAAYWALLAGACGHVYGDNSVWQMCKPGVNPVHLDATVPWHEAVDHPGAFQMRHVRRLFETRPFHQLVPEQGCILDGPGGGGGKVRVARAADRSFAIAYSPRGEQFTLKMDIVEARRVRASWFDPRYGMTTPFCTSLPLPMQTFTPPTHGRGRDWVLLLDDDDKQLPLPGLEAQA